MKKNQSTIVICFTFLFLACLPFPAHPAESIVADVNSDGTIDMNDVLGALQVLTGKTPSTPYSYRNDVAGDGNIGPDEIIFALQQLAALRSETPGLPGYSIIASRDPASLISSMIFNEEGDALILFRKDGEPQFLEKLVFRNADGTTGILILGDNGLPASLDTAGYLLTYGNYTETTVDITVQGPDGSTTVYEGESFADLMPSGTKTQLPATVQRAPMQVSEVIEDCNAITDEGLAELSASLSAGWTAIQLGSCLVAVANPLCASGAMSLLKTVVHEIANAAEVDPQKLKVIKYLDALRAVVEGADAVSHGLNLFEMYASRNRHCSSDCECWSEPIALIDAGPQHGVLGSSGLSVSLDASGSIVDTTNGPATYEWTSSAGHAVTGVKPTITFTSGGIHTVNLKITDANGLVSEDTTVIEVTEAKFTVTPASGEAPLTVSVDASASWPLASMEGVSYAWSDEGLSGATSSTNFSSDGRYNITLKVTDRYGQSDYHTELISIGAYDSIAPTSLSCRIESCTGNGGLITSASWIFFHLEGDDWSSDQVSTGFGTGGYYQIFYGGPLSGTSLSFESYEEVYDPDTQELKLVIQRSYDVSFSSDFTSCSILGSYHEDNYIIGGVDQHFEGSCQGSGDPDLDGDGSKHSVDCDNRDPSIHPGAHEICGDGIDQDCDGIILCPDDIDDDNDGFTENDGDCDDANSAVYPGAREICGDGIDQNCDGSLLACEDVDIDGDGWTVNQGDCDETAFGRNPGADEICDDGIDQDCNGDDLLCGDVDDDSDGYTENQGDCNDGDSAINPGATETCGDSIDQDCNGSDQLCPEDIDDDHDGYTENQGDCNDTDWSVRPNAYETCGDSIDQDCDGSDLSCDDVDNDNDGYTENQGDCNDNDYFSYPGAQEYCDDSVDQDCDGSDLSCNDVDNDGDGLTENQGDCNDTDSNAYPGAQEFCDDSIDQDCDGSDLSCNDVDNDGDGVTENQGDCDDYDISIFPGQIEICGDFIDQDCDTIDPLCPEDIDDDGDFFTENQGDCDDTDNTINPMMPDFCGDGIDQNCDGSDSACLPTAFNGGWWGGGNSAGDFFSLTIFDDGMYLLGDNVGIEFGTLSIDQSNTLGVHVVYDQNGDAGFSHVDPATSMTVSGNTLTLVIPGDGTFSPARVVAAANPLIGSWDFGSAQHKEGVMFSLTIYDDNTYIHCEFDIDDQESAGVEFGSYTYNQATQTLIVTPIVDQNGDTGPSGLAGVPLTVNVVDDVLTLTAGSENILFNRVR